MLRKLIRHPIAQKAFARLLGLYLGFCYRTARWSLVGHEHLAPFATQSVPVVAAFWHERLPDRKSVV